MKAIIIATSLFFAGAVSGHCQAPNRSLASIFHTNLAFYLPAPDSAPISTSIVNATGGTPTVSQNAWVEIHGTDLAPSVKTWDNEDFSKGLPTSLDGVSATVNNKPAAIYFISPTQVNILTPLDTAEGSVPVQLKTALGTTAVKLVPMQKTSPGFFVINAQGYVAARHANYALIGPTSLSVPGYPFTPAQPKETVLLYANGFGQTSPAITGPLQTGALPTPWPTVTIGGFPATVSYAGLSAAGLYQFNVVVPDNVPDGDAVLKATFNGVDTQDGVKITIKR